VCWNAATEPFSKLLALIMSCLYITHIMACLLYMNGHPYHDLTNGEMGEQCGTHGACGWVHKQGFDHYPANSQNFFEEAYVAKYVTALYYASTQITTVGFGDISATTIQERLYAVFSQIFGGFMFGYLLGNISTILSNENQAALNHSRYLEELHHFMKAEGIPAPLHRKVMQYIESRYAKPLIHDEERLFKELPPRLLGEIAVHRHGLAVEQLELFADLKYTTLYHLCARINLVSYMQGETISNIGAHADKMFCVKEGTVHVAHAKSTMSMRSSHDLEQEDLAVVAVSQVRQHKLTQALCFLRHFPTTDRSRSAKGN
jgi:hypothetical protein